MTRFVDIDGTICRTFGTSYITSEPMPERIAVVNKWYDEGDRIVYWTSRGMGNGKDWRHLTMTQLSKWGCRYHQLRMDKPIFDAFYDDHAHNAGEM